MTPDDQTAMDQTLADLRRFEASDLLDLSAAIGRLMLVEAHPSDRATALAQLQMVPTMLSFQGVSLGACNFHLNAVFDELRALRARDAEVLADLSTELTMHAPTLLRVSARQSSGMILLARVLYVLAHEDQRG